MSVLDALLPWSVNRVADALDLHPFEVIRLVASQGPLPADLRLHPVDVARVVDAGGLETWWEEPPDAPPPRAAHVVPALAEELLRREIVEPRWTRADNLYRGLAADGQAIVRRAVNAWIRSGVLASRMAARGLEVAVRPAGVAALQALAGGAPGPYAGLLEDT